MRPFGVKVGVSLYNFLDVCVKFEILFDTLVMCRELEEMCHFGIFRRFGGLLCFSPILHLSYIKLIIRGTIDDVD